MNPMFHHSYLSQHHEELIAESDGQRRRIAVRRLARASRLRRRADELSRRAAELVERTHR